MIGNWAASNIWSPRKATPNHGRAPDELYGVNAALIS